MKRTIENCTIRKTSKCGPCETSGNGLSCYGYEDGAGDPLEDCCMCKLNAGYDPEYARELRQDRRAERLRQAQQAAGGTKCR